MTSEKIVLVTGANSGLGLGICLRLIDDFLRENTAPKRLRIIFTTRSQKKASDTLETLENHLKQNRIADALQRVTFQAESNVELTSLLAVRDFSKRLNASDLTHLDAIICNAGIGGWSGLNWPQAVQTVLADIRNATTWPQFKLGVIGSVTKPQFPNTEPEPVLGEVFCANLFGHYMLAHWLMPLLRASPGKIIWISSIEPQAHHLSPDDLQGLKSDAAYEHGKRLTDLLNLTSTHPAAAKYVSSFLALPSSTSGARPNNGPPAMHEMQPGIVVTSVISLYWIVHQAYMAAIYLARLLGAPWSTVQPYTAALAAVWLALASESDIQQRQHDAHPNSSTRDGAGKVKWGTAVSRFGTPFIQVTDVEQWGVNGSGEPFADSWWGGHYATGGKYGRGRNPAVSVDATREDVEEFIRQGVDVWKQMEQLRREWEERIEEFEQSRGKS